MASEGFVEPGPIAPAFVQRAALRCQCQQPEVWSEVRLELAGLASGTCNPHALGGHMHDTRPRPASHQARGIFKVLRRLSGFSEFKWLVSTKHGFLALWPGTGLSGHLPLKKLLDATLQPPCQNLKLAPPVPGNAPHTSEIVCRTLNCPAERHRTRCVRLHSYGTIKCAWYTYSSNSLVLLQESWLSWSCDPAQTEPFSRHISPKRSQEGVHVVIGYDVGDCDSKVFGLVAIRETACELKEKLSKFINFKALSTY